MKLKIRQLAVITVGWISAGMVMALYDHLLLVTHPHTAPDTHYLLELSLAVNAATGLIGSLLGGSFLVFYVNEKFYNKPYRYTLLAVLLFFLFVVGVISIAKGLLFSAGHFPQAFNEDAYRQFMIDAARLRNILMWFVIVCLTQVLLQMNSRIGNALMGSFIRGKYNIPREEQKIVMFLDLNASTTIAERIGDERYHELLRDFFSDIANPVLENSGSIYQYVGDEVIVSWDFAEGIRENNCIRCFFDIKKQIGLNREKYLKRYGFVPTFKAGFHCGKVVAGEVGTLKREITYSGDVLNTTSRILNKCQDFGAEVIMSGSLLSALCLDKTFQILQLGSMKLKGKEQEVALSEIKYAVPGS